MTTRETKQHEPGTGNKTDRFTRANEVIHEMIEFGVNVKSYRPPYNLSIFKGNDPATGEQIFNTQITKLEDGSFAWERNFRAEIEECASVTCVLKSEENLNHTISWRVDLDMRLAEIVSLNTDTRAAAGR